MARDKIIIKDLLIQGIIGINPEERIQKQDILVNVCMYTDITQAGLTEDLSFSLNYASVADRIVQRIESGQDLLVEKLALDLARIILQEFGAERVLVRVEKPTAVQAAKAVGVEIERSRQDLLL